jgi:hypothetical protein
MVRRPAHGPRFDVIQLAARAWAPIIITLSVFKQVLLAISHYSRDGAVVTDRNERQPPQNGGGGHDVRTPRPYPSKAAAVPPDAANAAQTGGGGGDGSGVDQGVVHQASDNDEMVEPAATGTGWPGA